mmetsp:Transcript_22617/g.29366  ORF Transcript_22617/g.29366 Transcript_22617/m.29366 type:complete len:91 (+) Transcript_22617:645-917(+)
MDLTKRGPIVGQTELQVDPIFKQQDLQIQIGANSVLVRTDLESQQTNPNMIISEQILIELGEQNLLVNFRGLRVGTEKWCIILVEKRHYM